LLTSVQACHRRQLKSFPGVEQSNQPLLHLSKGSCCTVQTALQRTAAELNAYYQLQRGQDSNSKTVVFIVQTQQVPMYHSISTPEQEIAQPNLPTTLNSGWEAVLIKYCILN